MKKRNNGPLGDYHNLEEAATFFLWTAFHHMHDACRLEVAAHIFGEKIMSIDPEPDWQIPLLPDDLLSLVQSDIQVLSDKTSNRMAGAWEAAQVESRTSKRRLTRKYQIGGIEIVGHVINLAACVEATANRHLFLLREAGSINDSYYAILERSETLTKILFCFKEEILNNKLPISQLKYLFRLRNHAVHFKASDSAKVVASLEELLLMWRNVGDLFHLIEGKPTENDVAQLAGGVVQRWVE